MKIPKFYQPILGVILGTALFLAGIAIVSCVFVGAYKAIQYARPFVTDVISTSIDYLQQWLPL